MFEHGMHDANEVMSRGHDSDLLAGGIASLHPREISLDRFRAADRLPSRFGQEPTDRCRTLSGNVPKSILGT